MKQKPQRKKADTVVIPDHFLSVTFLDAWDEFMIRRNQLKKGKDTEYAQGLLLDKIRLLSGDDVFKAVELIQEAIERKWISVFPMDKKDMKTSTETNIYHPLVNKNKPEAAPIPLTADQEIEMQKECHDELDKFIHINNKFPLTYPYINVFFHLERSGELKDSIDDKKIFMNSVIEKLQFELKALKEKKSSSEGIWKSIIENPVLLKAECRKQRTLKYFRDKYNLKEEGNV